MDLTPRQNVQQQINPTVSTDYSGLIQDTEKEEGSGADMDIVKMLIDMIKGGGNGSSELLGNKGIGSMQGTKFAPQGFGLEGTLSGNSTGGLPGISLFGG